MGWLGKELNASPLPVAGVDDPGRVNDPGYEAAAADDSESRERAAATAFGERLLDLSVSARSKKSWEQLAHTLDEIAPNGKPNPPTEMIMSIVEAIYDDYAKANFTNYELRREDLNQLAAFARQFKDVHEFLSQLALDQQRRRRAGAESGSATRKRSISHRSIRRKAWNFTPCSSSG